MNILERDNIRVLRAEILKAVYENHRQRGPKLRLVVLHAHLDDLHFHVGEDDLVTVIEDLMERGSITFEREDEAWRRKRQVKPVNIQITPAGRDLVERTRKDEAIQFD